MGVHQSLASSDTLLSHLYNNPGIPSSCLLTTHTSAARFCGGLTILPRMTLVSNVKPFLCVSLAWPALWLYISS